MICLGKRLHFIRDRLQITPPPIGGRGGWLFFIRPARVFGRRTGDWERVPSFSAVGPSPGAGGWGVFSGGRVSIFRENISTNRISWLSDTGLTYRVEGAGVLNSWSTLATGVPGNGGTVQWRTTNSGLRYFRVATEP